mmetsp:Transcript_8941/g.16846  ORF Transcript_8941/g.16846 Transcript_8941/m.16846 type:complete len:336 (-) Transcript_8941:18-1025(-)
MCWECGFGNISGMLALTIILRSLGFHPCHARSFFCSRSLFGCNASTLPFTICNNVLCLNEIRLTPKQCWMMKPTTLTIWAHSSGLIRLANSGMFLVAVKPIRAEASQKCLTNRRCRVDVDVQVRAADCSAHSLHEVAANRHFLRLHLVSEQAVLLGTLALKPSRANCHRGRIVLLVAPIPDPTPPEPSEHGAQNAGASASTRTRAGGRGARGSQRVQAALQVRRRQLSRWLELRGRCQVPADQLELAPPHARQVAVGLHAPGPGLDDGRRKRWVRVPRAHQRARLLAARVRVAPQHDSARKQPRRPSPRGVAQAQSELAPPAAEHLLHSSSQGSA